MHARIPTSLLVLLLLAVALYPPVAHMQGRGLTTGGSNVPAGVGHYYALVIGNNNYTALPKLKTAEADAREIERLLREAYGFQTKLLVNATRSQIVAALAAYRRELTGEANLLIYYAGHGYNDKDADKAYWLPVDATIDDSSNWIIADEITTGIRVVPARHVLVISDSCYSGTLTRGLSDMLPRPAGREQFLQRMAAGHSRTLMASGGDEPVADSGGGGHSVFAAALLRGLQQMDKGQFTAAELFNNYVVEAVAGRAEQTPLYNPLRNSGHESGDFIFVKLKVGDKTVEVTVSAPPAAGGATQQRTAGEPVKNPPPPEATVRFETATLSRSGAVGARRQLLGKYYQEDLGGGEAVDMMAIPAGIYVMGSPKDAALEYPDEEPPHQVTVRKFYLSKYEVTQSEWRAVATQLSKVARDLAPAPSAVAGDDLPVTNVSWEDVEEFCARLTHKSGRQYRLPSESEWEYAARAGTASAFAFGETITPDIVNYDGTGPYGDGPQGVNRGRPVPVGSLKVANAFGLYDMHGNVWEWCAGEYHANYRGAPVDGSPWNVGGDTVRHMLRGGSYNNLAVDCRSANRYSYPRDGKSAEVGFRLAVSAS